MNVFSYLSGSHWAESKESARLGFSGGSKGKSVPVFRGHLYSFAHGPLLPSSHLTLQHL